jgi:hypothetical protein
MNTSTTNDIESTTDTEKQLQKAQALERAALCCVIAAFFLEIPVFLAKDPLFSSLALALWIGAIVIKNTETKLLRKVIAK